MNNTKEPLSFMDIDNYVYLWRKGEYKYDIFTNVYTFYDGKMLSEELLRNAEYEKHLRQNRLYWNSLPWWKKMFKKQPFPL